MTEQEAERAVVARKALRDGMKPKQDDYLERLAEAREQERASRRTEFEKELDEYGWCCEDGRLDDRNAARTRLLALVFGEGA